jgi:hypothetical protein
MGGGHQLGYSSIEIIRDFARPDQLDGFLRLTYCVFSLRCPS